jgi:glutamine synthetase
MVATKYVPTAIRYQTELATNVAALKSAGIKADDTLLKKVGALISDLNAGSDKLAKQRAHHVSGVEAEAAHFCNEVLPTLVEIRVIVDALEAVCPDDTWPVPTYEEMLFIR